jgi:hypothetical protein
MAVLLQSPRGNDGKNHDVKIGHYFLQPDPTEVKAITEYDNGKGQQYHHNSQPGNGFSAQRNKISQN